MSPTTKKCSYCGETKPRDAFSFNYCRKSHLADHCKACEYIKRMKRKQRRSAEYKELNPIEGSFLRHIKETSPKLYESLMKSNNNNAC